MDSNVQQQISSQEIQASGGDWAGYGELFGQQIIALLQSNKLHAVFANDAILVAIQRTDGQWGTYRLLHSAAQAAQPPQPKLGEPAELSSELDKLWTFQELWPLIQFYAAKYGFDAAVLAGVIRQESGFRNWQVHKDGTGYGLLGIDDNGMMQDFERWSGLSVGRGAGHLPTTPNQQIEYAAQALKKYQDRLGSAILAAQAWHRGEGLYQDQAGVNYGNLIRQHIRDLGLG